MNWPKVAWCAVHGGISAVIVMGTAITALQAWPTKFQWLALVAGAAMAGGKDVLAYMQEPK